MNEQVQNAIDNIANIMTGQEPTPQPQNSEKQEDTIVINRAEDISDDNNDDSKSSEALEEEDHEDDNSKKESRAQKRIRELISKNKELQESLQGQMGEVGELKKMVQQYLEQSKTKDDDAEQLNFQTQDEFATYIEQKALEKAQKIIEDRLAPYEFEAKNNTYVSKIDSWFKENSEAAEYKESMNKLSQNFTKEQRSQFENDILSGNTFILDALYAMASKQNSGLIKQAVKTSQKAAITPNGSKSTKGAGRSEKTNDEAIMAAYKKGSFVDLMGEIIPDYLK